MWGAREEEVRRVEAICRITTQLQHSSFKEMYKEVEVQGGGVVFLKKKPAFSTTPLSLKSHGCLCYAAKRVRVLQ